MGRQRKKNQPRIKRPSVSDPAQQMERIFTSSAEGSEVLERLLEQRQAALAAHEAKMLKEKRVLEGLIEKSGSMLKEEDQILEEELDWSSFMEATQTLPPPRREELGGGPEAEQRGVGAELVALLRVERHAAWPRLCRIRSRNVFSF